MRKIRFINPQRKPLTMEKLKALTGWETLSDEQAEECVHSIRLFVKILYFAAKKDNYCIDNKYVVNLADRSKPLNNVA